MQYSASHHHSTSPQGGLPGVFFEIDISPLVARYTDDKESFWAFLINLLAIIGGIYAVSAFLVAAIYEAERRLAFKSEIGKAI